MNQNTLIERKNPQYCFLLKERKMMLHSLIDELPPKHKELVVLYYFKGEPQKIIAKKFNSTPGAISVTLFNIRKKLRRMLTKREYTI